MKNNTVRKNISINLAVCHNDELCLDHCVLERNTDTVLEAHG